MLSAKRRITPIVEKKRRKVIILDTDDEHSTDDECPGKTPDRSPSRLGFGSPPPLVRVTKLPRSFTNTQQVIDDEAVSNSEEGDSFDDANPDFVDEVESIDSGSDLDVATDAAKVGEGKPFNAWTFTVDMSAGGEVNGKLLCELLKCSEGFKIAGSTINGAGYVIEKYQDGVGEHRHGFFRLDKSQRFSTFVRHLGQMCDVKDFWKKIHWKPARGRGGLAGWQRYCRKFADWEFLFGDDLSDSNQDKQQLERLRQHASNGRLDLVLKESKGCPAAVNSLKTLVYASNMLSAERSYNMPIGIYIFGQPGAGKTSLIYDIMNANFSPGCVSNCDYANGFVVGDMNCGAKIFNDFDPVTVNIKFVNRIIDAPCNVVNVKGSETKAAAVAVGFTHCKGPKVWHNSAEEFGQIVRRLCLVIRVDKVYVGGTENEISFATEEEAEEILGLDESAKEVLRAKPSGQFTGLPQVGSLLARDVGKAYVFRSEAYQPRNSYKATIIRDCRAFGEFKYYGSSIFLPWETPGNCEFRL